MKVLILPNNSLVSSIDSETLYFSDTRGGGASYGSGVISKKYFDMDVFWGVHVIDGQCVEVFIKEGGDYRAVDVANELIIKSEDDNLFLDFTTKDMLVNQIKRNATEILTIPSYRIVNDQEEWFVTFYNLATDTYYEILRRGVRPRYVDGDFFHFLGTSVFIHKCDNQLNEIWQFDGRALQKKVEAPKFIDQNAPRKIINLKKSIIVNFACERTKRKRVSEYAILEGMESEPWFINGELYCFNNDNGEVNWTTTFPLQIDDIELADNGNVIVASERFLYVVNTEDGAILDKLDTQIRTSEREEQISITLLNHNGYLFVFSFKDCVMQIFNSETLELLRSIDEKERGWHFARYSPKVFGTQIVVPIEFSLPSINSGAMLVLDTDDIHAEIEVEEQPEFDITMPDQINQGVITCDVNYPDWSVVLRTVEMELFNAVICCSGVDTIKHFKPRTVVFNYSGYEADKEEVIEKMEIFKQRFEKYMQEPHIPGISIPPIEVEYNLA